MGWEEKRAAADETQRQPAAPSGADRPRGGRGRQAAEWVGHRPRGGRGTGRGAGRQLHN